MYADTLFIGEKGFFALLMKHFLEDALNQEEGFKKLEALEAKWVSL